MRMWTSSAAALAAAAMLAAGVAQAQSAPSPLTYVAGADDGADAVAGFLAMGEMRREGDIVTIPSLIAPVAAPSDVPYRYVATTIRFDCKARTGQIVSVSFFDAGHQLLASSSESQPPEPFDNENPSDKTTIGMACGEIKPGTDNRRFVTAAEAIAWLEARPRR